jgi:methylated-DNA-[protein]-cysteine S-methyltransferase
MLAYRYCGARGAQRRGLFVGFEMSQVETVVIASPFGPFSVSWSVDGLTRVRLLVDGAAAVAPPDAPAEVRPAVERLVAYFSGQRIGFVDLALDTGGVPPFHARIYAALRQIGYGAVTTYGALAVAAGSDVGASRAVGVAMGKNPWPVVVPCHRVLAGNKLGGFSAPGGAQTKQRLLVLEGAYDAAGTPDLFG